MISYHLNMWWNQITDWQLSLIVLLQWLVNITNYIDYKNESTHNFSVDASYYLTLNMLICTYNAIHK